MSGCAHKSVYLRNRIHSPARGLVWRVHVVAVVLPLVLLSLPGCQPVGTYVVAQTRAGDVFLDGGKSRPFGPDAQFSDLSGPPPPENALVLPGTGQFLGRTREAKLANPESGDKTYTLNLVGSPVPEAAKAVLGDIFGVNYTIDPKIDAQITVQTSRPLNQAGIAELFQSALRTSGIAIVKSGNVYRIVTADQAAAGAQLTSRPGSSGSLIGSSTRLASLQYISPTEMKRILEPLSAFGGVVRIDEARNAVVLSGTEQEIASMEEVISVFDVDVMKGMSFALVPVGAVEPDAIVDDLNKIFASGREGPMTGMVQFIANKRLKSILVISKQPRYLAQAQQWVRRLDSRAVGTQKQLYTYMLRNRQVKEVIEVLNSVFSAETAVGDHAPRGDVAPQFRRATIDSAGSPPPAQPQITTSSGQGGSQSLIQQSFSAFGVSPRSGQGQSPSIAGTGDQSEPLPATTIPGTGAEPRIKIMSDASNNSLIIRATQADFRRVERFIASLDVVPNQVLIEATICEVTLTDNLRFGVRWFFTNKHGSTAFSSALDGAVSSVFPGFSWVYKAASTQVTLNALNDVADVNVLASPSLMVLDSRTAHLQIGDQVPITTQTATSVLTPGAPVVNSVTYKDTGIILAVTPRINEAGRVLLEIEQEVSTVSQTTSSNIDSPTFGRRRVKTTVLVNNGEAITLGGLIQDKKSTTATQIPVLGSIPIFGNAFKDKIDTIEKTELIILLTPRVVRDLNEAQQITEEYRRKVQAYAPRRHHPAQLGNDVIRILQ
jgi:general secretion pathway protein D